jgi:integrase/recombinase XerC
MGSIGMLMPAVEPVQKGLALGKEEKFCQLPVSFFNEGTLDRFICGKDAARKTLETYRKAIRRFFCWLERKGITSPIEEDIVEYKRELETSKFKSTTIAQYVTSIKQFFRWVERKEGYVNVAKDIKCPSIDKGHKKDYLTRQQAKELLCSINRNTEVGLRDYAMILLMVTTGLRTIEVARANIEDLGTKGECEVLYVQGKGKSDKKDFVKVAQQVGLAIRQYLRSAKTVSASPLFIGVESNCKGKHLSTRSISRIVKNRLRNAGYNSDRLTAHSLRHTAVTLSLLEGATIQEAQQLARHGNINTTLIYAHNIDKMKSMTEQMIADTILN